MPVCLSMIPGTPMPTPNRFALALYFSEVCWMASHMLFNTWSRPSTVLVPSVIFSMRVPCSSTAAMRKFVPPRSTPMEKLGIGRQKELGYTGQIGLSIFDCQFPIEGLNSKGIVVFKSAMGNRQLKIVLLLAFRAVVAASSPDDHALHGHLADQARFSFTTINPVSQLKEALFTIGIDIVGNRRSAQGNRLFQDFPHRHIQVFQLRARDGRNPATWTNPRAE